MVAADGDVALDATEDRVFSYDMAGCRHTMKDIREILQLGAKDFAYGLVTQANTQYGLLVGIGANDVEQ